MKPIRHPAMSPLAKHSRPPTRASVCLWILGVLGASVVFTGLVVLNAITLNSDARAMRAALVEGLDLRPATRVQLSIGPVMLDAARLVLRFVDHVPEEARLALSAARGASVGVYSLNESPGDFDAHRTVAAADAAMNRRGWSRVVAVTKRGETVLVYTPTEGSDREGEPLRVCVGICQGRELVVVSAKLDSAPLLELVDKHHRLARR